MYTFCVLLLMAAHVFTIIAQYSEEMISQSVEEDAEVQNIEEEEEEEEEYEEEDGVEEEEEEDVCVCIPFRNPVCGNDGITYANKCRYKCAADRDATLRIKFLGACEKTRRFLVSN